MAFFFVKKKQQYCYNNNINKDLRKASVHSLRLTTSKKKDWRTSRASKFLPYLEN